MKPILRPDVERLRRRLAREVADRVWPMSASAAEVIFRVAGAAPPAGPGEGRLFAEGRKGRVW